MSKRNVLSIATGVSTEPDVQKLDEHFGKLEPGRIITKQEVADIIRDQVDSNRFKTVVDAWRRKLLRGLVTLGPERGVGWKVLNDNETGSLRSGQYSSHIKCAFRSVRRMDHVDVKKCDPETRRQVEAARSTKAAVQLAYATAAKQLPPIP